MSTDGTLASTTSTQDAGGKNFVTTTTMLPEWGVPTKIVDPNNRPTEAAYDALGRVVSVWDTNRARTATPNIKYAYTLSKTSASVRTSTLNRDGSGYIDSVAIYDSPAAASSDPGADAERRTDPCRHQLRLPRPGVPDLRRRLRHRSTVRHVGSVLRGRRPRADEEQHRRHGAHHQEHAVHLQRPAVVHHHDL
ncbi:hypothetical protein G5V59_24370 [Nocardioides sp. W3-2-3]|nr:hypothetical protein [Nocardioides convexus]